MGHGEQLHNLDSAIPLPISGGNKQKRRTASNAPSPALPSVRTWDSVVPDSSVGSWFSQWEEELAVTEGSHSLTIECPRGLAGKRKDHQQEPKFMLAADSTWK